MTSPAEVPATEVRFHHSAGFPRVLEEAGKKQHDFLTVIQDRMRIGNADAGRVGEAIEASLRGGRGHVVVHALDDEGNTLGTWRYSAALHCADCDIDYQDPLPSHFSFNSPLGACDTCRGFGRVINVASFAGLMPAPAGHTLYAASKSYLIRFSEALALENRHHGINVCALCPGFTLSEFHDVTGSRKNVAKMPKWIWLRADDVARVGIDAAERGEIVRVVGAQYRLIKALFKLIPDKLALKLIAAYSGNFRVVERGGKR